MVAPSLCFCRSKGAAARSANQGLILGGARGLADQPPILLTWSSEATLINKRDLVQKLTQLGCSITLL